jgi:hypothetical protein
MEKHDYYKVALTVGVIAAGTLLVMAYRNHKARVVQVNTDSLAQIDSKMLKNLFRLAEKSYGQVA